MTSKLTESPLEVPPAKLRPASMAEGEKEFIERCYLKHGSDFRVCAFCFVELLSRRAEDLQRYRPQHPAVNCRTAAQEVSALHIYLWFVGSTQIGHSHASGLTTQLEETNRTSDSKTAKLFYYYCSLVLFDATTIRI